MMKHDDPFQYFIDEWESRVFAWDHEPEPMEDEDDDE